MEIFNSVGIYSISIIVMAIYAVSIYNSIISKFNTVNESWSNVIVQERVKRNIIPKLESLVSGYKEYEKETFSNIVRLRSSISDLNAKEVDVKKLSKVESVTNDIFKGLRVTMENYPELKANTVFLELMEELSDQEENVGSSIKIFNNNVRVFNDFIQMFPNSIINNILNRKKAFDQFYDTSVDDEFEYKI